MCNSRILTGIVSGGASEQARAGKKSAGQPERQRGRDTAAEGAAAGARKKAAKGALTSSRRKANIQKFSSNVASGGQKRAANVGK